MKKFFTLLVVFAVAGVAFGNGVSLNSPGTRAISMGGAYIAHVNDYSAPYWNPAGLVNVEGMQASAFFTLIMPSATYKSDAAAAPPVDWPAIDATATTDPIFVPNLSFLWKCILYDKLHLGLSMIVPAGLGVEWDGDELKGLSGGQAMEWKSSIAVINLSLSAAMQFGDKLNAGAAFHLVRGTMELSKGIANPAPLTGGSQYQEESDGWGYGLGIGVQYMLNDKLTLGASLRTKMGVTFKGEAENPLIPLAAMGAGTTAPGTSDFEREITWPLWVGGGVAYKAMDNLMIAFDVQWSQWEETQESLVAEFDDPFWEAALAGSGDNTIHLNWESQMQIRLGAEYMMSDRLALRGGFYLDPAPGPDDTQTILIPNTDFTAICLGAGYAINDKMSCDFGLEYLMGAERDISDAVLVTNPDGSMKPSNMMGKHTLDIFVPSLAFTYTF